MKTLFTAACVLLMTTVASVALSQPPFAPPQNANPAEGGVPARANPDKEKVRDDAVPTYQGRLTVEEQIIELQREKVMLLTEERKALRSEPMFDPQEVDAVERQLIYAKIELAELEGDPREVVKHRRELLVMAEETLMYARRQLEKGTGKASVVRKANVDLLDAKIGLVKAQDVAAKAAPIGKVPAKKLRS